MGTIFISHSSKDNARAIRIRDWLKANGWDRIFLDLDPEQGLLAGQRWRDELKRAGENCAAVLVLVSPSSFRSEWCKTEFMVADQLSKRIFPVIVEPTPIDEVWPELRFRFHMVDASTPDVEEEGLERLGFAMRRAGLNADSFDWPPPREPNRPIYRGLQPLDVQDAAIFFGRDAAITRGLDELRRLRDGAPQRMMTILGASGAGKSSFLRAGLIARLVRDDLNFVVAPIIRPDRATRGDAPGLFASMSNLAGKPLGTDAVVEDLLNAFARVRAPVMERIEHNSDGEAYALKPPTIIIPIDQAEGLFAGDNPDQAAFCKILEDAVKRDGNALIVATVRTDSYEALQNGLLRDMQSVFTLPRIPVGQFHAIVEGPARLAKPPLTIEPALTQRLLDDLDSADALPLAAFTLERLFRARGQDGALKLQHYEALGGLKGSIEAAVDDALFKAQTIPGLPRSRFDLEALLRRAFIPWLASINPDTQAPRRRVAAMSELPKEAAPLIRLLVDQRLLSSDSASVEPAHEALLRQWGLLESWLLEEQVALATLEGVRRAAQDWAANGGAEGADPEWLQHRGLRLLSAEEVMARPDFAAVGGVEAGRYVAACRQAQDADREREAARREEVRQHEEKNRLLQRRGLVALAVAGVALLGVAVGLMNVQRLNQSRSDTLAALALESLDDGRADRAARYALAGMRGRNNLLTGFDASASESLLRAQQQQSGVRAALHHDASVRTAMYSPDGARVLTASFDHDAALWDVATGRLLWRLRGHADKVEFATFSPDGRLIATTSFDGTARIWNAERDAPAIHILDHNRGQPRLVQVWDAAFSSDGRLLVTAGGDGRARVWDTQTGALVHTYTGHRIVVRDVAFAPGSDLVVSASEEGDARLWRARTGEDVRSLRRPPGAIPGQTVVEFSPDGKWLAIGYQNGVVVLWNCATWRQTVLRHGGSAHRNFMRQLSFDANSTRLLTSSADGLVRLWNLRNGAFMREFEQGANARGAVFSPSGGRIVTVGDNGVARVWDTYTGALQFEYAGHEAPIWMARYAPDGNTFVTASGDGQARIWTADLRQDTLFRTLSDRNMGPQRTADFSPDGRYVATASYEDGDGVARVWDVRSGRLLRRIPVGVVQAVVFSQDGRFLATAGLDTSSVRIWEWQRCAESGRVNCESGRRMQHRVRVMDVAFSPDGREVLSASRDNVASIWSLSDRSVPRVTFPHRAGVSAVAYSPDGTRVASASYEDAYVWDPATGREICQLVGHTAAVRDVGFSHDNARIITVSEDRTVRIWNARTCAPREPHLELPGDSMWSAEFSHDDSLIIVSSQAFGNARIYNAETLQLVNVLLGHKSAVWAASFSFDGQRAVTASQDRTARIWTLPPPRSLRASALVRSVCKTDLAAGLSRFSDQELRQAPALDPVLDRDACRDPSLWLRITNALGSVWRAIFGESSA